MAEDEPNATQSCGEGSESEAASCNVTQPKADKESENTLEDSQKDNQDGQQVGNQAQGEGENKECCKEQALTNQNEQNKDTVEKQLETNNGQEEKKSALTENGAEKEDDDTDPIKNECHGEKNDKPVDGVTAQPEKEKSQVEEKQETNESEEQKPCTQKEKKDEQDEDKKEKVPEQEGYTGEPGGKRSEATNDAPEDRVVNIDKGQKNENQGEKNDKPEEEEKTADESTAACEKEKSQVHENAAEPKDQSNNVTINNVKEGRNDVENVQKEGKGSASKQAETREADQQKTKKAKKNKSLKLKKERTYITITTGKTQNTHEEFLNLLHGKKHTLKKVDKEKEFKFIMVFCPVVSRVGTDIDAALCELKKISESKPAVLVVLHCTNDPECVVPDSSRTVSREKMIAVDCLFKDGSGLHQCEKNKAAMETVVNWLKAKPWK